jgi:hypothetical protein
MAPANAEHEDAIKDWIKGFEELPAERQENLKKWFATQKVIIDNSGQTPKEWFSLIQWAMDNPFDYSFINDFPDGAEIGVKAKDAAEKVDTTRDARQMVGAQVNRSAPDGKGIQEKAGSEKGGVERELFDRFMKERLGGGRK